MNWQSGCGQSATHLAADDIERAVRAWERNGRNAAWLLAGQRLQSAEALAEKPAFRHRLEPARAYLQASRRGDDRLAAAVSHRKDASVSDALQQKLRALLESDRFIPYRDHQATITESLHRFTGQSGKTSRIVADVGGRLRRHA